MVMKHIRKGDTVVVIAGNEKGKTGSVANVNGETAIVSGLNMKTHYVRRNQQNGEEGGLKKKEGPIHLSNLAFYDEESKKPVKIGVQVLPDGKKIRYNKRTKKEVGK